MVSGLCFFCFFRVSGLGLRVLVSVEGSMVLGF